VKGNIGIIRMHIREFIATCVAFRMIVSWEGSEKITFKRKRSELSGRLLHSFPALVRKYETCAMFHSVGHHVTRHFIHIYSFFKTYR
jgi:hypothetical protein